MRQYSDLYFTTATIFKWSPLLAEDRFKDIIIDAFRFCVTQKRANIWAFVIMENHIHLVWHILSAYELLQVRQGMLKFTAQKIIATLLDAGEFEKLNYFKVGRADRNFQIWQRDPLSIEILNEKVLAQKINYIHNNLSKKGLNDLEYKYSSASYYETGIKNWDFL
jgi:putative transposase